jgi:hypothetical protein
LPPMSNLFNKLMSDMKEKLDQTEKAFEELLDDFNQSETSDDDSDSETSEPDSNESRQKREWKYSKYLPECDADVELDTSEVARKLKETLKAKNISQSLFAKQVTHMNETRLINLTCKPIKWSVCDDYKKRVYLKMRQWCESAEEIQSLVAIKKEKDIRASQAQRSSIHNLAEVPEGVELDTQQLVRKIKYILKAEQISFVLFATKILSVNKKRIHDFLKDPLPWSSCTEYKKRVYYRMHQWARSPAEIVAFRTSRFKTHDQIEAQTIPNKSHLLTGETVGQLTSTMSTRTREPKQTQAENMVIFKIFYTLVKFKYWKRMSLVSKQNH